VKINNTKTGVENKDLHREVKISSRHASILKQFATALELFNMVPAAF
jgi:hypothetical protein